VQACLSVRNSLLCWQIGQSIGAGARLTRSRSKATISIRRLFINATITGKLHRVSSNLAASIALLDSFVLSPEKKVK
jgi:hypothetical protein